MAYNEPFGLKDVRLFETLPSRYREQINRGTNTTPAVPLQKLQALISRNCILCLGCVLPPIFTSQRFSACFTKPCDFVTAGDVTGTPPVQNFWTGTLPVFTGTDYLKPFREVRLSNNHPAIRVDGFGIWKSLLFLFLDGYLWECFPDLSAGPHHVHF
jgi:hypothetical protein